MNKELQDILRRATHLLPNAAVLATVIDVQGSSYRLPGARMLITKTGETLGTVSGGCLEADVVERAKKVLRTNRAEVFVYDTTTNEDSIFSLNMGCRGVVRILLESTNAQSIFVKAAQIALHEREPQFVATLIATDHAPEIQIGGKIVYSRVEQFHFENLPDFFSDCRELLSDCERFFYAGEAAQTRIYSIQNRRYEFFFENLNPAPWLIIFGAGADVVPLSRFASELGWRNTIVDHRTALATRDRFADANEITISRAENFKLPVDEDIFAIVMTHNYEHDKEFLRRLLKTNVRYIGALGPKRRTVGILHELSASGETFSINDLRKLFAPVGMDIGGSAPETIALSIVTEINSVLNNRNGGFLRERAGSIYNRSQS